MFKTGQTAMDINTQSLPRRQTTKNTEITKKKTVRIRVNLWLKKTPDPSLPRL
jgi:hypothetical protein